MAALNVQFNPTLCAISTADCYVKYGEHELI